VLHDDGGSQPPTEARRRQQGSDSPDSCTSIGFKRSSDGHDITWTWHQHLSDSHVGMYIGLWLLSARHVSTLLHPHCTPGPSPYIYKRKVQGPRTKRWPRGRTGWRTRLSPSLANACNSLLQAHLPWAQDNTSRGSLFCSPLCSISRRPIWAGTRNDNLLVGPGTPRGRNADTPYHISNISKKA
jgi:hypothetical protein